MTITYHAGRRIQGLSTDIVETPDYTDYFSSDSWVDNDSAKIGVSSNVLSATFVADSTNDSSVYDLGVGVSDTEWILRFTQNASDYSGTTIRYWIGLSDSSQTASGGTSGTAQEFIGFFGIGNNSGNGGTADYDSAVLNSGAWDTNSAYTLSTSTDYHWEIARTSATTYHVKIYSDSGYTTLLKTWNGTCPSTIDNLRYIVLRNENDTRSGTVSMTIDDMKFWNGVSSLTSKPTNVQSGSRFEETDTRKIYYGASPLILDDDFTDYADQTSADNAWNSSDTAKCRVNITSDDLDFDSVEDGSNDSISYDMGSALSNTQWVCRFKFNISTADNSGLAPGSDRHQVAIGLFDVDKTVGYHSTTSKSAICLTLHLDRDGSDRTYFSRHNANTSPMDGAGQTSWSAFSTGTDYYCEIKRTSDANATMTIRTGSHTGSTALGTPLNLTTCSGIDDLRYFGIKCSQWSYGGRLTGTIDDVKIYDGVTSATNFAWTEEV